MIIVLHPTYTLQITVQRPDPTVPASNPPRVTYGAFWDEIGDKTGCDQVLEAVRKALEGHSFSQHVTVRFENFEERGRR